MRRGLAVALLPGLVSCAGSAADRLERSRGTVVSWTASARWAAVAWAANQAPRAYARDTVDLARDGVRSERQTLSPIAARVPAGRDVLDRLDRVSEALDGLAAALDRGDRAAITPLAQAVDASQQAFSDAAAASASPARSP